MWVGRNKHPDNPGGLEGPTAVQLAHQCHNVDKHPSETDLGSIALAPCSSPYKLTRSLAWMRLLDFAVVEGHNGKDLGSGSEMHRIMLQRGG